jgi:carbon monoxide dehydrogenase subunit G
MTVRVSRSFDIPAPPDRVWEFIADPANRARAISVVERYTVGDDDPPTVTWHVALPIPFVRQTMAVETRDVTRDPPTYVKFVGTSNVFSVTGAHELTSTDEGCRLDNQFAVEGSVPGVETFFKRNLDSELENLHHTLREHLDETAG